MKKRSLLFLIGLAAAVSLAIAMALPASHYVIVGILHQESFYNGRPTSYWIDALKHEPFARRSAPAQDIGAYLREGGFEALPVLRQMLHDQDTQVASEARMAISLILRDVDSLRISELLSFAKDRDPQMRQMTLQLLGRMQPGPAEKVPTITEALLRDEDAEVRAMAAVSLRHTQQRIDEVAAALRVALEDPDKTVRFSAASTLATLEPYQVDTIPVFLEILKDPRSGLSNQAAQELGKLGKKARAVLPALEELLQAGEGDSPHHAATALDLIGFREELIEILLRMLKEGALQARLNALSQLQRFPPPPKVVVPLLIEALKIQSTRRGAVSVLSQIGPAAKEAVPELAEVLKTEKDTQVRVQVLFALRSIAPASPDAVSVLLRCLDDPDSKLRLQTAGLLPSLEHEQLTKCSDRVLSVLVALLKDKDEEVASGAAWALWQSQAGEAISGLQAASKDPRIRVSSAAASVLRGIDAHRRPSSQ